MLLYYYSTTVIILYSDAVIMQDEHVITILKIFDYDAITLHTVMQKLVYCYTFITLYVLYYYKFLSCLQGSYGAATL